jgi:predicted nucleotidyltransferase
MKDLKDEIAGLARKYRLQIIYAFGSRAKEIFGRVTGQTRRSSRSKSDLDIGVKPQRPLTVKEKVEIALFFEDRFDVPKVDVVVIPEAPALLAYEIVTGELLYAKKENFEAEYQLYIMRRAGDLLPYERLKKEMILGK